MYIYKSKRQKWRLQAALVVAISCIQFPVLGAGVVVDLLKDSPKAPPRHESFVKTVVFKYGFDNDVLTGLSSQATGGRDCSKGGRCLNEIYDEHFRRFDLKHAKSNSSQFGANFKTNDIKIDTVYRSAVNRALTRAVVDTLSITPMLRAVFEGKIDLDLDVGSFFESGPPLEISEPMRPVYRVVSQRQTGAARPPGVQGFIPQGTERQIIEEWPEVPKQQISHDIVGMPKPKTFGQRFATELGLSSAPFTRYKLNIAREARGADFKHTDIKFRFQELNGLLAADLTQLLYGDRKGISLTAKIPYKRHSLNISYANLSTAPIRSYVYWINDATNGGFEYNPNNKSYTARLTVALN